MTTATSCVCLYFQLGFPGQAVCFFPRLIRKTQFLRYYSVREAITAIPFTGLIDADCRFTVYSRSSTNGPVPFHISTFVLEVKLFLYNHDGLHQLALAALSSYDTAPAPVFKGLPSLLDLCCPSIYIWGVLIIVSYCLVGLQPTHLPGWETARKTPPTTTYLLILEHTRPRLAYALRCRGY